jgi:hypothetical protein
MSGKTLRASQSSFTTETQPSVYGVTSIIPIEIQQQRIFSSDNNLCQKINPKGKNKSSNAISSHSNSTGEKKSCYVKFQDKFA